MRAHNPLGVLELALLTAVVGIAAAVAVPEYLQLRQDASDDSARTRLAGAARKLEARHHAAGTFAGAGLPAGVRLHLSRGSYCIETNAGDRVWHAVRHAGTVSGRC